MTARTRRPGAPLLWRLWWLVAALGCAGVCAGEVQDRVQARGEVRVCIRPNYHRISFRDPRSGQLSGLDIDLASALAADLRAKLRFVDSSFATLEQDLRSDRCDVAMFGIPVLTQRVEQIQFATPYLQSDIYAVTTRTSRVVRQWRDIDQPGVLVGVQDGSLLEPLLRQRLRNAGLVSIAPPHTRERELIAGRVDVFMADYPYGRTLIETTDWAALLVPPEPFHVLTYAHATKPGDAEWMASLNAFEARIQQDGRLDAAARRHGLENMVQR